MMLTSPARVTCAQESCIPSFDVESKLEARFECPICLQCLQDPLLTSCGHRFCKECINAWLKQKGGTCPVDGQVLNEETDLFPDNFTRREINDLEERTSQNHSQKVDGDVNHGGMVECNFRDVGCLETLPEKDLPTHLETHLHSHLSLLSTAYGKLKISVQNQQMATKSHEASFWDPGTKGHSGENGVCEESSPWQGLMRSLYERIVVLEQRNHEQEIQLENLKRQLSSVSATSSAGIERLSQDLSLKYCGGVLVWTVSEISEKLEKMLSLPNAFMEYSPSFYTSPSGYRFCARLNISPKERDHLALLIHLKRGDNDQFLDWPFSGRISFTLINHLYPHLHLHETMMSRPELDAFKRPIADLNPRGFGYTEFLSVYDLRNQGFIYDNRIVIKIQVQCV
ncbi:hypothetical protein R5R35_014286 [Gryllus longicercus]|uniref:TNF receptor-associated factor 6 n=1 Tax=Gryllus longicercus TaxID=2509291 RepID=A0AAN9W1S1_9ORTH